MRQRSRRRLETRWRSRPLESLETRLAMNGASSVAPAAEAVDRLVTPTHAEVRSHHDRDAQPLAETTAAEASASSPLTSSDQILATLDTIPTLPYDQGQLGSCTANAVAAAIAYQARITPGMSGLVAQNFLPSRLFIYYNTRFNEGSSVRQGVGTTTSEALKTASIQGVAAEEPLSGDANSPYLPYSTPELRHAINPGAANYLAAREVRVTGFQNLAPGLEPIQESLNAGKPVLLQVYTYQNFNSTPRGSRGTSPADPGSIPTIAEHDQGKTGSHLILAVGYNDTRHAFLILNSWGKDWGGDGYAYLPYSYVENRRLSNPNARYTISGVSTFPPPTTIGSMNALVDRDRIDRASGQIHIDTTLSPSAGTATSMDFYTQITPGRAITPLLFSYNAQKKTYTLTGIGRSYIAQGEGAQGMPFVRIAGRNTVGTNTAFGFLDGQITDEKSHFTIVPSVGTIPFSTQAETPSSDWLTSTGNRFASGTATLKIGETFATAGKSQVRLDVTPRVYSAMLVE